MNHFVERRWFRLSLMVVGLVLFVIYGLMFIPVAVNLPASWPGFIYIAIGLGGGVSALAFLKSHRRMLLVPAAIAVLMTVMWAAAIILFGESIDRELQSKRLGGGVQSDISKR